MSIINKPIDFLVLTTFHSNGTTYQGTNPMMRLSILEELTAMNAAQAQSIPPEKVLSPGYLHYLDQVNLSHFRGANVSSSLVQDPSGNFSKDRLANLMPTLDTSVIQYYFDNSDSTLKSVSANFLQDKRNWANGIGPSQFNNDELVHEYLLNGISDAKPMGVGSSVMTGWNVFLENTYREEVDPTLRIMTGGGIKGDGGIMTGGMTYKDQVRTLTTGNRCYGANNDQLARDGDTCNQYVVNCVARDHDNAFEDKTCRSVLTTSSYFDNILPEHIQKISPVYAVRLLRNLHFQQHRVYDDVAKRELEKVESYEHWAEKMMGGRLGVSVTRPGDFLSNSSLVGYLKMLVAFINANPAILNADYHDKTEESVSRNYEDAVDENGDKIFSKKSHDTYSQIPRFDLSSLQEKVSQTNDNLVVVIDRKRDVGVYLAENRFQVGGTNNTKNFVLEQYKEYTSSVPEMRAIYDTLATSLKEKGKELGQTSKDGIEQALKYIEDSEAKLVKYLNYIQRYNTIARHMDNHSNETLEGTQIKEYVDKYNHVLKKKAKGEEKVLQALEKIGQTLPMLMMGKNGEILNSDGSRMGHKSYKP